MNNKGYIVVDNGLFKTEEEKVDSRPNEFVIHTGRAGMEAFNTAILLELERQLHGIPIIFGTAGEYQLENEQIWADTRNETQTPEINLSQMTEQQLIEYYDNLT